MVSHRIAIHVKIVPRLKNRFNTLVNEPHPSCQQHKENTDAAHFTTFLLFLVCASSNFYLSVCDCLSLLRLQLPLFPAPCFIFALIFPASAGPGTFTPVNLQRQLRSAKVQSFRCDCICSAPNTWIIKPKWMDSPNSPTTPTLPHGLM